MGFGYSSHSRDCSIVANLLCRALDVLSWAIVIFAKDGVFDGAAW